VLQYTPWSGVSIRDEWSTLQPAPTSGPLCSLPQWLHCKATMGTAGGPPGNRKGLMKLRDALTPACGLSRKGRLAGEDSGLARWPPGTPWGAATHGSISHDCFRPDGPAKARRTNTDTEWSGRLTMNDVFVCVAAGHFLSVGFATS